MRIANAARLGIVAFHCLNVVRAFWQEENSARLIHESHQNHYTLEVNHEKERESVAYNREEIKHLHFEATGKELTEEDIDAAIKEARNIGPGRWEEGYKRNYVQNITDMPENHIHIDKQGRRFMQLVPKSDNAILVSGLSPGWPHNSGRSKFYCVTIDDIQEDGLPKKKEKLVLKDCKDVFDEQTSVQYSSSSRELKFALDGLYWEWCVGASNRKSKMYVDICDEKNPLQVWDLFKTDNTWRPDVDTSRCVTATPPKAGRRGGGKLKLTKCSQEDKKREAQVFIYCIERKQCTFIPATDKLKLTCKFEDDCTQYLDTVR